MLEKKVLNNLLNITLQDKVLVAVSGGVDSMVLLKLLRKHSFNITVAHCNFGLRGSESDAETSFLEQFCHKIGVACFVKRFDTKQIQEQIGGSTQEIARDLRYTWFNELMQLHDFKYLAVAHNQNDSTETFFINLFRGAGLKGLSGIREHNNIIRPLLNCSRQEIETYATNNNIEYKTDSSNANTKYLRNSIRNVLLPQIYSISPTAQKGIVNAIQNINSAHSLLQELLQKTTEGFVAKDKDSVRIDKKALLNFINSKELLFYVLQPYGFNIEQCESIVEGIHNSGNRFISQTNLSLIVEREHLMVLLMQNESQFPGSIDIIIQDIKDIEPDFKNPALAYIDADTITTPLSLRAWQQGDYFYPIGLGKKKKLSDFFNDIKLDNHTKQQTPILIDANNMVVWVVGYRLSNKVKITENTIRVIVLNSQNLIV